MSALPAVRDTGEAADLLRAVFAEPPEAASRLATPDDAGPVDAALRWLLVALPDLPVDQAALLRGGAARLLSDPALSGYVVCLLEEGGPGVAQNAASATAAGNLRGIPATPGGGPDQHALLLGLCARLDATLDAASLRRDLADPRYRDLALLLAAGSDLQTATDLVAFAARDIDPSDEYATEALGRALRVMLEQHGEMGIELALRRAGVTRSALMAGVREAVEPARLAWLTEAQRAAELDSLRRRQAERPVDAYLRLRLDPEARRAFFDRVAATTEETP